MSQSSPAAVTVRRAGEPDAAAIASLTTDLGYPVDAATMQARLRAVTASAQDLLLVAVTSSGEVSGWLQAHSAHILESGFRVEIVGLIVSPRARRTGVGRALIIAAEQWAKELGAGSIVVRSNIQRAESHAFYPALGFALTKAQHVYRKSLSGNCP